LWGILWGLHLAPSLERGGSRSLSPRLECGCSALASALGCGRLVP